MVPKGRFPDETEAAILRALFPSLAEFSITGEPDVRYNCVGWSVGESCWIEPGSDLARVDRFYRRRGFHRVKESAARQEVVAVFALARQFTHVARRIGGDAEWWESKLGRSWRIVHRLRELAGDRYGAVVRFYATGKSKR